MIDDCLSVGVVGQAFGTGGWCKINAIASDCSHFQDFIEVYLEEKEDWRKFAVEGVRCTGAKVMMKFSGIDSREAAKELTGKPVRVERKFAQALEPGEYYCDDICQCRVFYHETCVGEVVAVCQNPAHDILEIKDPEGNKILIPFVDHFIGSIDYKKRRIELKEDYILR